MSRFLSGFFVWSVLRRRGLGAEDGRERDMCALLVHVRAAHTDRTNELIVHDDRQIPRKRKTDLA
jgi:hypothetical protein